MRTIDTDDPAELREMAELCLILAARTPHLPQYRQQLVNVAAECTGRADEIDPGGMPYRTLIAELRDYGEQGH